MMWGAPPPVCDSHRTIVSELPSPRASLAEESDDRLVERVLQDEHDPRPFEVLVRRHQGFVRANCRVLTRSSADADDLAQEVFVKAYFGLRRFEGRSQLKTWLRRIKVNHCLNYLRAQRGGSTIDIEDLGPDAPVSSTDRADAGADQTDLRERIVAVLDELSDTVRVPLMLRDADGMSYEEIATTLGISLSAVKMRIKRGREEFRKRWEAADATAEMSS